MGLGGSGWTSCGPKGLILMNICRIYRYIECISGMAPKNKGGAAERLGWPRHRAGEVDAAAAEALRGVTARRLRPAQLDERHPNAQGEGPREGLWLTEGPAAERRGAVAAAHAGTARRPSAKALQGGREAIGQGAVGAYRARRRSL